MFWIDILRRLPSRDRGARWAINMLIARFRLKLAVDSVLQPLEKQYIRPLHARVRSALGS